jgi:hypothetical protein
MIGDIILQADEPVALSISFQSVNILSEVYVPDVLEKIHILELWKVLLPQIKPPVFQWDWTVFFVGTISGQTQNITFVSYYATSIVSGISLNNFRDKYFWTALEREKTICRNQTEFLSVLTYIADNITLTARYRNGDVQTKNLNVLSSFVPQTLDVSPAKLFDNIYDIVYFTARCGDRHFTWYIVEAPPRAVQFKFMNSFGCYETFVACGDISFENKYTDHFSTFEGQYRLYDRKLIREYSAATGVLSPGMSGWLEDMFSSPDVNLLGTDGSMTRVVITEATVKRSSARDEIVRYEFKYRLARSNHNEIRRTTDRIFDDTFDYTFN